MRKEHINSKGRNETQPTPGDLLKIAVDVHAAFFVVACQMDGSMPKPVQKLRPEAFIDWLTKQIPTAGKVVCCYEAGPTGFWLHRRIVALGITNYVVCPTCLDSRKKGVNTDKTDAKELLSRLDRYVAGNQRAFSIVRVPTLEEEQRRVLPRQRQQLRQTRLSLASRGRCLLLLHGIRVTNAWWKPAMWNLMQNRLPPWLLDHLAVLQQLIDTVHDQVMKLTRQLRQKAAPVRPKGLGAMCMEQIDSEVCDWGRFKSARRAGGYTGLTGGVSGSGSKSADLSITKAGNKRLRTMLVELAWRLSRLQPKYWLVEKWKHVLLNPRAHARRRKQVIVAFARQLFVDLWKWRTGRVTGESLGWIMNS